MKCKLLILLMVCFVGVGCSEYRDNVVSGKFYVSNNYDSLPPCICLYYFNGQQTTQDSCNKYNVGDTLIHSNHK